MCPFLLWMAPVVDGSCCGWLQQYTFEKSSRCSCPAFISPIPKPFALSGYFLNLCLPYTQSHFSAWVYSLIPLPYTQGFSLFWVFLLLFTFYIPKDFSFHGYSYCFLLLYTQRFFFPWVFLLLLLSLYPKIFSSMGILTAFCFSIPKVVFFSGYMSDFCVRYTQTSIFI